MDPYNDVQPMVELLSLYYSNMASLKLLGTDLLSYYSSFKVVDKDLNDNNLRDNARESILNKPYEAKKYSQDNFYEQIIDELESFLCVDADYEQNISKMDDLFKVNSPSSIMTNFEPIVSKLDGLERLIKAKLELQSDVFCFLLIAWKMTVFFAMKRIQETTKGASQSVRGLKATLYDRMQDFFWKMSDDKPDKFTFINPTHQSINRIIPCLKLLQIDDTILSQSHTDYKQARDAFDTLQKNFCYVLEHLGYNLYKNCLPSERIDVLIKM